MALIVEDGTGKEDANSFVSVDSAREIALIRAIVLPEDDAELEAALVRSADRLQAYEVEFYGQRRRAEQGLSYPRIRSKRFGNPFPENSIPTELKLAQVKLAAMIGEGLSVWAVEGSGSGIKEETVGPLKTVYADSFAEASATVDLVEIDSILSSILRPLGLNIVVGR